MLYDLVRIQLNSAGCMNKGFILDGFPRSKEDAKNVFMVKVPVPLEDDAANQEGSEEPEQKFEDKLDEKIVPQYAIAFEADDAFLAQKTKDLPPAKTENNHHNEAGMARRLKEYRTRNVDDSGDTVRDFFTEIIGYQNVLHVDCQLPEADQLAKMQEVIEQKGKPCCINMISDDDRKFLANLEKQAAKEARAKARAEAAAAAAEGGESGEQTGGDGEKSQVDAAAEESPEEIDEIDLMIEREQREQEEKKRQIQDEIEKKLADE